MSGIAPKNWKNVQDCLDNHGTCDECGYDIVFSASMPLPPFAALPSKGAQEDR